MLSLSDLVARWSPALRQTAAEISARLGYRA
jgi:DNA-binding IclR family transcriptional regulator